MSKEDQELIPDIAHEGLNEVFEAAQSGKLPPKPEDEVPSPPVDLADLNNRHAHAVDKWYRMCAGSSSRVVAIGDDSFDLRVTVARRLPEDRRKLLLLKITNAWGERGYSELSHCRKVRVLVYLSPASEGFNIPAKGFGSKSGVPIEEQAKALGDIVRAQFAAAKLPRPFLAEFEAPINSRSLQDWKVVDTGPRPPYVEGDPKKKEKDDTPPPASRDARGPDQADVPPSDPA